MNIIANPLTIYGTVAVAILLALYLVVSLRLEMAQMNHQHRAETESLRHGLEALQQQIEELKRTDRERPPIPPVYDSARAVNMQKRAEALRMYRRGSDPQTVAAALGMPVAEVRLLQKVQKVLADQAAEAAMSDGVAVRG